MAKSNAMRKSKVAKAVETEVKPTLRVEIQARMLTVAEQAGVIALSDAKAAKVRDDGRAKLWAGMMEIAIEIGKEKFPEYWESIKPDLKKPENAVRFGSVRDAKAKGDVYNISEYLTQVVSRIKSALNHGIRLKGPNGIVPQTKLVTKITAANLAAKEARLNDSTRKDYDPLFKDRVAIHKALVDIAGEVRKGSHSQQQLADTRTAVEGIARVLKGSTKAATQQAQRVTPPASKAPAQTAAHA